jgi:serine/threonine-protein kinase
MDDSADPQADKFREVTGAELPAAYAYIRELGRGSMASVFLVRNTALKRLVAVKVMRTNLASDEIARKRFIREAQAAARISHPSVTSVYTVGSLSNDDPFIEMQYIDGSNLAEVLQGQGRFDVDVARNFLVQLSGALAAAHECGVIHRDVEPANVLIESGSGRAFLTDFGVAGILESGSETVTRLTREGDRLSNPTYMSPEQLRGEALTPQSDVYGIGILGYEMLAAHGPFGNAEISDVAGAHIRRAPIDLHEAYPNIPREFADTLKRCLSKKPENRPRAKVLSEMLERSESFAAEGTDSSSSDVLSGFLHELQKRKVYRATATYAVAAFAILQVADLILPSLSVPDRVYRWMVVASLTGFPVAVALAWCFDLRDGRLIFTEESEIPMEDRRFPRGRLVLQVLGLSLSVAISGALAWWLLSP